MKHFIILLLTLTICLVACDDADDKIKRTANAVVVHEGTKFILFNRLYAALDTIVVEETRLLSGTTSIQENVTNVGYSINGLGYRFKTYNAFDNMYFNFEGDDLVWIGSSSFNSGFFFKGLKINKLNNKNIEFEFDENFAEEEHSNYFQTSSSNNYMILIDGKISFTEKGK